MSIRPLMVLLPWLFVPLAAVAQLPAAVDGQPLPSLAPMIERVQPAVVNINSQTHVKVRGPFFDDPFFRRFFNSPAVPREREQQSLGSGVIVDAVKGYVLTNNHVIDGADDIQVTLADGRALHYRTSCEFLPVLKGGFGEQRDDPQAAVFSTAYLADSNEARGVCFAFNGGPGSSSVWLHLGALGPKRVVVPPQLMETTSDGANYSRTVLARYTARNWQSRLACGSAEAYWACWSVMLLDFWSRGNGRGGDPDDKTRLLGHETLAWTIEEAHSHAASFDGGKSPSQETSYQPVSAAIHRQHPLILCVHLVRKPRVRDERLQRRPTK